MIIERFALFAILSTSVVLAIVTDSARDSAGPLVDRLVEVTGGGMIVAVARSASVRLLSNSWLPRQIVVEVLAFLAVEACRVVGAFAPAVHHVLLVRDPGQREAPGCVAVARAGPTDHHVLDSVVVFLADLRAIVQQIVSQGMQPGHVDSEIGDFQQILHLL